MKAAPRAAFIYSQLRALRLRAPLSTRKSTCAYSGGFPRSLAAQRPMHLVPEEHNLICSFFPRRSSLPTTAANPGLPNRLFSPTTPPSLPPLRYTGATQCMLSLFP